MQITAANIGDVIKLNHSSLMVRVEDVSDKYVTYSQESGDRYATHDHEIDGQVVTSSELLSRFARNAALGYALNAAETKALTHMLSGRESEEDRKMAEHIHDTVSNQKKAFLDKLFSQEQERVPNAGRRSVDDIIKHADQRRASQATMQQHNRTVTEQQR